MRSQWQTKTLGEVCSLITRGISPKYVDSGGVLVINQRCIRDHKVDYGFARRNNETAKRVPEDRFVRAGDGLINSTGTGTLGRVALLEEDPQEQTTVDSHVTIVRPIEGLFSLRFFGYMLFDIENQLKESGEGCGGQTELARNVIAEKHYVRFPKSISEQERIVAVLDEAFEGIVTAKANTDRNLQCTTDLFRAALDSHVSAFIEQGKERALSEVAEVQSGGTPRISTKAFWEGNVAWYSSGELNELYTSAPKRYITQMGLDNSNAKLFPKGSLLIGMYDTAALKMSITDRDAAFNQAIAGVKPNESLDLEFLLQTISAKKATLLNERRGTRQKNLSLAKIKAIRLKLPSLTTQKKIVEQLRRDKVVTEHLADVYNRKAGALEELKHSLLHQAFTGNL